MDRLIPIINKLQDVFHTVNSQPVDLPQIAVVGSQSAGKSSVLESLVGRDFLPRGNGIVTRRPLVLQLINSADGEEWAEFLHDDKKYTSFEDVRAEIVRETERVAPGKGICDEEINLKVYSPKVLNMTMIDLPGLTKVAVEGQPQDIRQKIRELVLKYISRPNCIILAVSAANVDLATSDALQIAREVDPEGNRTLGVLTKVDIMDKGTHCLDILHGRVIPLKMGYIAVKNRSQADIQQNKSIEDALKEEREYFITHQVYRTISDQCGYPYLARRMNNLLINHIKNRLPALKQDIHTTVAGLHEELQSYGDTIIDGTENQGALLLHLISKFATNFANAIDGTGTSHTNELYGGARIINILHVVFQGELDMIGPFSGLNDHDIRIAIKNSCGARLALFVPDRAFEILVKQQIQKLRLPCLSCVERVFEELQKVAAACETTEIKRFRHLSERLAETVRDMMRRRLEPSISFCNQIIDVELAYINTKHPDLITGGQAAAQVYKNIAQGKGPQDPQPQPKQKPEPVKQKKPAVDPAGRGMFSFFGGRQNEATGKPSPHQQPKQILPHEQEPPMSQREQGEVKIIKNLLRSYFEITKKQIADQIPKVVMHFLVNTTKERMQSELVSALYKEGQFEALLSESPEIAEKRRQCRELLVVMKKALEIVNEIRDIKL